MAENTDGGHHFEESGNQAGTRCSLDITAVTVNTEMELKSPELSKWCEIGKLVKNCKKKSFMFGGCWIGSV